MKIIYLLIGLFCFSLLQSCTTHVNPEQLYGEWTYIKVENPNSNPPDSVTAAELAQQKPSIIFSKDNDLVIMWGGAKLSSGKFRIDKNMIRYTESLKDGNTREFPFLVSRLNEDQLVFETMEQSGTRVTAIKR